MKAHEALFAAKAMLDKLVSAGINPKDVRYLDLYNEYVRLREEGHKATYIQTYICDEYQISRTKFYEMVKIFDAEL